MSRTRERFWLGLVPSLGVVWAALACTASDPGEPIHTAPWFEGAWTRPAFPGADPYRTDLTVERGSVVMDAVDAAGRLVSRVSGHVAGPQHFQMDDGRLLQVGALPDGGLRLVDPARGLALDFYRVVYSGGPAPLPPPAHGPGGCDPWLVGTWAAETATPKGPLSLTLAIDPAGVVHQTSVNRRTGEQIHLHGRVIEPAGVIEYEHGVALHFERHHSTLRTHDPRDGRRIDWARQGGGPAPAPAPIPQPAPAPTPSPTLPAETWSVDGLPSAPNASGLLEFFPGGTVHLSAIHRQTGARDLWVGTLQGQEVLFSNGVSMSVARDANTLKTHDDRNGPLRWRRRG